MSKLSFILSLGLILPFSAGASVNGAFVASGSTDVTESLAATQRAMAQNAQAQCGAGQVAVQVSETEFTQAPRSFPTKRTATAQFVCR